MSKGPTTLRNAAIGGAFGVLLGAGFASGCAAGGTGGFTEEGGPADDDSSTDAANDTAGQDATRPEAGVDATQPDTGSDASQADGVGSDVVADVALDVPRAATDGGSQADVEIGAESGGVCTTTVGLLLSPGTPDGGADDAASAADTGADGGANGAADASSLDAGDAAREAGRDAAGDGAADAAPDGSNDASRAVASDGAADVMAPGDAASEGGTHLDPLLLFGFDNGSNLGWGSNAVTGATVSLGATLNDGHACLGALQLYTTYTAYNANPLVQFVYGGNAAGAMNWSGRSKLHVWLKVTTSDYTALSGARAFVLSNNYVSFGSPLVGAATLADRLWHETTVDLTPPPAGGGSALDPSVINGLGAQIVNQSAATAGGPAAPSPTTLLVDDIWLE
ncbi:MAG: hypothetical protein JOZ69_16240 [Myxococcales bacterium]|nr:hypothetical protein [Myxococcales bacterium]